MPLMNGDREAAATVAMRSCSEVERRCSPENEPSIERRITVTLGVASLLPDTVSLQDLLRAANEEMYRAKQAAGKNRIFVRRAEGL